jgi:hypothetical protein
MLILVGSLTSNSGCLFCFVGVDFVVVCTSDFFAAVLAAAFAVTALVLAGLFLATALVVLGRLVEGFFFVVVGFFDTTAFLVLALVVFAGVAGRFVAVDGFLAAEARRFGLAGTLFLGAALETDLLEVLGITTSIQNRR